MENEILLQANAIVNPPPSIADNAYISPQTYRQLYQESIADPEGFWARMAQQELHWMKPWNKVFSWNYPNYKWFEGGQLNITYNCLDRHVLNGNRNKIAFI